MRKSLEDWPEQECEIRTLHGLGYQLYVKDEVYNTLLDTRINEEYSEYEIVNNLTD